MSHPREMGGKELRTRHKTQEAVSKVCRKHRELTYQDWSRITDNGSKALRKKQHQMLTILACGKDDDIFGKENAEHTKQMAI